MPDIWLVGNIKPIYKNKGNPLDPKNFRPITILSCLVIMSFLGRSSLDERKPIDASQGMYMSKIEIFFFTARILQNQRMLCCGECFHD
jgi:hypothetical protein